MTLADSIRHTASTARWESALELWRGPALADVADAPFAGPQALRLEELRLAATEDLFEAELSLPEASPAAGLRELLAAHPLRERPRGLLMRALHAAGRPAEALAVYDEGRRLLAEELGTDPSPELAALHLEILRGERERTVVTGLPAQLTSFVGRADELARLGALLPTARLVTIVGPGGTGKTRLAIEAITRPGPPARPTTGLQTDPGLPTDPDLPTDPELPTDPSLPTDLSLPTDPGLPTDSRGPGRTGADPAGTSHLTSRAAGAGVAGSPRLTGRTAADVPDDSRPPDRTDAGATGRSGQVGRSGAGVAVFVDLSLVDGGAGQVARAVLGALGLREPALRPPAADGDEAAGRLVAALAEQDLLLVLDNCEHVIDEAATLTRHLLARCPGLTVLATSREPLGLTGEHLVPLAPLPTPPPGADDPLGYPAVRLFADRAAAVRQGFTVNPANLDAVLRICVALDGLPLAIELAAARVRTFGVAEIADRLAEHGRFRLLSRGDRTAAARHRTLHAVVEWSWSLLDAEEQALARRLSVFAGGATLEAVERVCHPTGAEEAPAGYAGVAEPAETLAGLVDKSLVETDGERYQMLDTIRLFCLERLAEAGEEARLRQAHAAWFLEFAGRADDHLYREEQLEWLARLSADNANLQAALRWSVEHDRPTALRLVAALGMYWWLTGRRGQATRHAVRLLDAVGTGPPDHLAHEAQEAGAEEYVMAVLHAVPEAGSPHWERARAIVGSFDRPMRYRFGVALWGMIAGPPEGGMMSEQDRRMLSADPWSRALDRLGSALMTLHGGLLAEAESELERVLADFGAVGERWGMGQAYDWLALIASWRGDWPRAMELWDRALGLFTELGALDELADVLSRRGNAHWRAGNAEAARADNERAAELERRLGRPELMAWVQLQLGDISRLQGDLPEAARRLDVARSGSETGAFTAGGTRSRVYTALGRLAAAQGDAERAARMHAEALAAALGSPLANDVAEVAEGLAGQALFEATHEAAASGPESASPIGPGSGPGSGGAAGKGREAAAETAAMLLGVGAAVRGMAVVGDHDVAVTAAGATGILGPEAFAAAYARGAAMSRDEALTALRAVVSR
ncbi:BTAD domain-containing putative transcriptional regulator [Nonomuraea sp. NPDC049709]|uniref:ATP-binding protein n=1 Tax=Nonomuraea sp. NPDC049709 TaxID=3154736 RepID=UPI0034375DAA